MMLGINLGSTRDALQNVDVTRKFYEALQGVHDHFFAYIDGIDEEIDRRWYVSVLLHRLMFIYFLQRKAFMDNENIEYLQQKLLQVRNEFGSDHYYEKFLLPLFFEGFAKSEEERSPEARRLLGKIKYLNGGLFRRHRIEQKWPKIVIPDAAFEMVLELFSAFTWNLDDTSSGKDDELRPHILGYTFEKYINQKFFGAYYTPPEITDYLCEHTIHTYILQQINDHHAHNIAEAPIHPFFQDMDELLKALDANLCLRLLDILPRIAILDPACGSGAFLVSASNTLFTIYSAVIGRIQRLDNQNLRKSLQDIQGHHATIDYAIRRKIITDNLFGVDLMEEAIEIARLHLFITLITSIESVEQLEPLPNIDFNILSGNALIGFLRLNTGEQIGSVEEKERLVHIYKATATCTQDLQQQRDQIDTWRKQHCALLNEHLLNEFHQLGIRYEQATWNEQKQLPGKSVKRSLRMADIARLHPFHWGYDFRQIMNERGGFDIIITNPPWEALKPQAKEFFMLHESMISKNNAISKNKMRIEDFEKEQAHLLQDAKTRQKWLDYQDTFSYQSAYFRATPQYKNQISAVNGKRRGTDINLYKLFVEQCYNLLRVDGLCGIVVPGGIYTDLGAKQLRELLFNATRITGLFCFENNKAIFEDVHRSFKFAVLTYAKGGSTTSFPAAFMRHHVKELAKFPQKGAQEMSVELIRQRSPNSLSIMEIKNELDAAIVQKMYMFPFSGQKEAGIWNLELESGLHMTNDHYLFRNTREPDFLPLYEGKMIHQFMHTLRPPRYWIDEQEGRKAVLGRQPDKGQKLNYQCYRLGYRSVGRATDARALIATVVPANVFAGNSLILSRRFDRETGIEIITDDQVLFVTALMNSFMTDYIIGLKISANLNMFFIYELPIPRLTSQEPTFNLIVRRAARLICATPEFADLWQAVYPNVTWSPEVSTNNPAERAQLRAEIDGLVAHLYGLSEEEFAYVLETFPLVEKSVKQATLQAYRDFMLLPADLALLD